MVVDDVPAGMTPSAISHGGVWDGDRITWTIGSLAPGASQPLTYVGTVDSPATAGEIFHNTAEITTASLGGGATGQRTATSDRNTGYRGDASATVSLGEATLSKTVQPTSATIGEQVTYTAEVTFPANVNYYDATVIDTLPDGLVYDGGLDTVACVPDPCDPSVLTLASEPQVGGATEVAWYLGDLTSIPVDRTYTITYKAHVAEHYDGGGRVLDGNTLVNAAQAFYNSTDQPGTPTSIPDPGTFSDSSNPSDADLGVIEPLVTIDKNVSGDADGDDVRDTQPGDTYTYSLVVANDGDADAFDVAVSDAIDNTRLTNVDLLGNPDVTDDDPSDGTLGWTIPEIPAGTSATITYTADLAPSAVLHDGDTVVNTADVDEYWGVPAADRLANPTWDFHRYADVPPDTVTLNVRLPELTVDKTAPNGTTAQVGEAFDWRVEVTNASTYADAEAVDVRDVLPPDWEYVEDSASFAPGGPAEPAIAADPSGDQLTWSDVADLGPGQSVVLTFRARPTVAAIANGTGAGSPHVNDASATGADASGATASADGPYEGDDSADAVLELPELSVAKTPDGDVVHAGDPAAYSIRIDNDGDVPARDVVVTDTLGAGQSYTADDATANPPAGFAESSVTAGPGDATTIVWTIAEIPAHDSVTITVPIETDASLPDGTDLENDASVVSREVTTPVGDTGGLETDLSADVGIDKQAQSAPVDAGDQMDFTIEVYNHGPSDARDVVVHDDLPDYLTFVSTDNPNCTEAPSPGEVTCEIDVLPAGESVEIALRVEIDADRTDDVSNTATVTAPDDSTPGNNSSTADKPIGVAANVTVDKQAPAEPVLQGTDFDYTIQVSNTGVSAAQDVTLEDDLPDGVTFVAVDNPACAESSEDVVACDFGTLEPGAVVDVTITAHAVDVGTPTNTAIVDTTSTETTEDDNQSSADVTIVPAADLGVTKSAPATVDAGGQIAYSLTVVNNGPSDATGVSLVDTLPAGTRFVSADPGCSEAAGIVTCAVGDLAVSESRDYTVTVEAPYALADQVLTNSVVVAGNEGDLVPENDSDQATTTVGPAADVAIVKTSNGAIAGGTASWTLVVSNHGPSTADPVTVTDELPAGVTLRSAAPGQGSCGAAGATVTCELGAIAAGGTTQIAIVADVPAGTAGQQLVNRATAGAPQPDPDPSNNTGEVTTPIGAPAASGPNLTLTKKASTARPKLGSNFGYRLVVTNTGDAPAEDVRIVDTMSRAVDIRRVTTTKGTCTRGSATVECELGTLAAGEQETVRLVVRPTGTGRIRNVASASVRGGPDVQADGDEDVPGQPDLDPTNNSDTADVTVAAPRAGWTLRKQASRRAVRGGQTVRFAITVRAGRRAIMGARVCDRLPDGLVFVRAPGARFRDGRACWTLDYLGPRARRTLRVVARAERGFSVRRVRNVATATARNAGRRTAAARVRIDPAFGGAGGGVTG